MMQYRKATFADIEAIYHLVNDYATDGVMLARSRNTLYETAWRRSARWRSRQS